MLSFNLGPRQVRELYVHFPARYRVHVIPTHEPTIALPRLTPAAVLQIMETRASFGDAQVLAVLRSMEPPPDQVVSWNAAHFAGRLMAPATTPAEAVE